MINYRQLVFELIRDDIVKDNMDLNNDYYILAQMQISNNIDLLKIDQIRLKYESEITQVDNYRIVTFSHKKINNKTLYNYEPEEYLEVVLNHLIRIMCLRYVKNEVDENIKRSFATLDDEELYSFLKYLIDKRNKYLK